MIESYLGDRYIGHQTQMTHIGFTGCQFEVFKTKKELETYKPFLLFLYFVFVIF